MKLIYCVPALLVVTVHLEECRAQWESNKPEKKAEVEAGGWTVAWADDISETDAIAGVITGVGSIYSGNPAPFLAWVEALVDRTVSSLTSSAERTFPDSIQRQARELAAETIKSAIQNQDAREVFREYDTVDFKAGAIRYSGRNYQTIRNPFTGRRTRIAVGPPAWGLKPYVAFRWRGSE